MKRPKPFAVGRVRVRVHSGPRDDGVTWRWRADLAAGLDDQGRQIRRHVWAGWATREQAEVAVAGLVAVGLPEADAAEVTTVFDLLDCYIGHLEELPRRSPHTARHRRYAATAITKSSLGGVELVRLDRGAIERYRDAAIRGGRAASTVREDLVTLGAAWRWGRERGLTPDRELPRVTQDVKAEDAVYNRHTPSGGDVERVLSVLRTGPAWAWRAAFLLAATGCRRSEIATLAWAQVDLSARVIVVAGKTGRRRVPLHPDVAGELAGWERVGERVLGCAPNTVAMLTVRLQAACAAAGVQAFSAHGLRRAGVTRMYRAGVDPSVAAAVFGHSPTTAMKHYRAVAEEDLASAVLAAGLSGVLSKPTGE
jgi:integrase